MEETTEMVRRKSEELLDKTQEALESMKQLSPPAAKPDEQPPAEEKVRI